MRPNSTRRGKWSEGMCGCGQPTIMEGVKKRDGWRKGGGREGERREGGKSERKRELKREGKR